MVREGEDKKDPVGRLKKRKAQTGRGPPWWAVYFSRNLWAKRCSPFALARNMPRSRVLRVIKKGIIRDQIEKEEHKEQMMEYLYQIFCRRGTTEHALTINFNFVLDCHTPLGTKEHFCSPTFPLDVSFIYGDADWVRHVDEDYAKNCVEANNLRNPGAS